MRKNKSAAVKFDFAAAITGLKDAGFNVSDEGADRFSINKYGCGAVIEKAVPGEMRFAVRPGFLMGGAIAHLVDRGFQKFWQSGERSYPARARQLKALHGFEQDLRQVAGLSNLYNEALGTVSSLYVYDRVEGREETKKHQPFD